MNLWCRILVIGVLVSLLPAGGIARAAEWGSVKGQIVWAGGKLPDAKELKVDKDQAHCLSKGKITSEEWVVDQKTKGIRWVFVWLAPEPGSSIKKLPIHPALQKIQDLEVEVDQPCCRFEPHALAMRQGQKLIARNSGKVAHNFNYSGWPLINPGKNELMQPGGILTIADLKADPKHPVSIRCNLHGWMQGNIWVFDHPYFAVTDASGQFEIKDAPAGDWRLMIWHDSGWRGGVKGKDGTKITIKAGAVNDLGKLEMKP